MAFVGRSQYLHWHRQDLSSAATVGFKAASVKLLPADDDAGGGGGAAAEAIHT
jgi:hypothetical protein